MDQKLQMNGFPRKTGESLPKEGWMYNIYHKSKRTYSYSFNILILPFDSSRIYCTALFSKWLLAATLFAEKSIFSPLI
jgi:hypothetical protein